MKHPSLPPHSSSSSTFPLIIMASHQSSSLAFFTTFFCLLFIFHNIGSAATELTADFYEKTCPNALSIIRSVVDSVVNCEARMGASLLRLHFHDCFVNGCDASILLDDKTNFKGEKTALPNLNSVRGYEVVDAIKSKLEAACPAVVSCADILAVAARDSVVALKGPSWTVGLGRRDSTTASIDAANTDIPAPNLNLEGLISAFLKKGFNATEMVALSGSHTIGLARCATFQDRIYKESDIDAPFKRALQASCPCSGGGSITSPLDTQTPADFDNAYYTNLVKKKGLLHSDQQLFSGGSTDDDVNTYRTSPATFFAHFANAMVKMGNLSVLTGSMGQIRINCRKIN